MAILYCFKYDTETSELTKIEIPEYQVEVNKYTERKNYIFRSQELNKSNSRFNIPERKLDRYISGKVYTFNPDVENIKKLIYSTLEEKRDKAEFEYHKYKDMLRKIDRRGFIDVKQ